MRLRVRALAALLCSAAAVLLLFGMAEWPGVGWHDSRSSGNAMLDLILKRTVRFETPDPHDASIAAYRVQHVLPLNCSTQKPFPVTFDIASNRITPRDRDYRCRYRARSLHIHVNGTQQVRVADWTDLTSSATVESDVTDVDCVLNATDTAPVSSIFLGVVPRDTSDREGSTADRPSVLVLVLDSVSLSAARRQMPHTIDFLGLHRFVVMNKYSKVFHNSRPNAWAMYAGTRHYPHRNLSAEIEHGGDISRVDFTFKQFARHGAVTMWDTDCTLYESFTGYAPGVPHHGHNTLLYHQHNSCAHKCQWDSMVADSQWRHAFRFHSAYRGVRRFSSTWVSSLSHHGQARSEERRRKK